MNYHANEFKSKMFSNVRRNSCKADFSEPTQWGNSTRVECHLIHDEHDGSLEIVIRAVINEYGHADFYGRLEWHHPEWGCISIFDNDHPEGEEYLTLSSLMMAMATAAIKEYEHGANIWGKAGEAIDWLMTY